MARSSSRGSHRATNWAVAQKPRPMPRLVRAGRPANDNVRGWRLPAPLLLLLLGAALALAALCAW